MFAEYYWVSVPNVLPQDHVSTLESSISQGGHAAAMSSTLESLLPTLQLPNLQAEWEASKEEVSAWSLTPSLCFCNVMRGLPAQATHPKTALKQKKSVADLCCPTCKMMQHRRARASCCPLYSCRNHEIHARLMLTAWGHKCNWCCAGWPDNRIWWLGGPEQKGACSDWTFLYFSSAAIAAGRCT